MSHKRCFSCQGTGQLMGNGMVMRDCHHCYGNGCIDLPEEDELDYLEIKQTERFKQAKEQLKKEFPDMSDVEAENHMTDALKEPKKKNRSKYGKRYI